MVSSWLKLYITIIKQIYYEKIILKGVMMMMVDPKLKF